MNEAHSLSRRPIIETCLPSLPEELEDAVIARTIHRWRPDDRDWQQIGDYTHRLLGISLLRPYGVTGAGRVSSLTGVPSRPGRLPRAS